MSRYRRLTFSRRLGDARELMTGRAGLGDWRPVQARLGRSSGEMLVGRNR